MNGVAQDERLDACLEANRLHLVAEPGALALRELSRAEIRPVFSLLTRHRALEPSQRLVVADRAQPAEDVAQAAAPELIGLFDQPFAEHRGGTRGNSRPKAMGILDHLED